MANNVEYVLSLKDLLTAKLNDADKAANQLEKTLNGVESVLAAVGIGFGVYKLGEFASEVVEVGSKMETMRNVINYTSKDAKDAAENHAFLKKIIEDYKLPMMETMDGFANLNAAMIGTTLQGQGARDVFEGVSIASTAMHLSAEKTNAVFYALNNMMSNGTVQAQDLKLQLGNALPGAFNLAAKSMGLTQVEFKKLMENGQVVSSEFLPKFAAYLKQEFGAAIPNAVKSTTAQMTDLKNQGLLLKVELFEALEPVVKGVVSGLTDMTKWLRENKELLAGVAFVIGGVVSGYAAYNGLLLVNAIRQGASTIATFASMVATDGLAAALYAAGIAGATAWALIGGGIGLVAAGILFAYEKLDWFRDGVNKLWSIVKTVAGMIGEAFKGIGMMLAGIFDPALMEKGFTTLIHAFDGGIDEVKKNKGLSNPLADKKVIAEPTNKLATSKTETVKNVSPKGATASRAVTINISINKMIETFKINTTNLQESASKVHEAVSNAMLQAINDSQIVGNI